MADELSVLDPVSGTVKLESGLNVNIVPLKIRQFFRLMKIVTHGAAGAIRSGALELNPDVASNEFQSQFLTAIILSLPDAEQEAIDFICSMVEPVGLKDSKKLSKEDKEVNQELWQELGEELGVNPDLNDVISIFEVVVQREASDVQALGKRLMGMFKVFQKTQPSETNSKPLKNEDSPSQVSI